MRLRRFFSEGAGYWLAVSVIVLASILTVFSHALRFPFWQEDYYLLEFVRFHPLYDYIKLCFSKPATHLPLNLGIVFRPLTHYVYFKLGLSAFGLNPALFRAVILFTLFLNALSLYAYCVIISGQKLHGLVAAIFYSVSRTHLAPVYWPTASNDTTVTLFMLLSVVSFLYSLKPSKTSWIYLSLSYISLVLALLSKEIAVATPILLAASVFLQSGSASLRERLSACRRLWPAILLVAVFVAIRAPFVVYALKGGGDSYYTLSRLAALPTRYVWGFWWNLETFVEPYRTVLNSLTRSFSLFQPVWLGIAGLALTGAAGIWLIRSERDVTAANPIWLGLVWFFISPLPALATGILAAFLFSVAAVGFSMVFAYVTISAIAGMSQGLAPKSRLLLVVCLVIASVVSARLVVRSLERTTWPVKHMPLAQETLDVARRCLSESEGSQTVCFVNFPAETWWRGMLPAAFRLFVNPQMSVRELTMEQSNNGECPFDAVQIKYIKNGTVVCQPNEMAPGDQRKVEP